MATVSYHVLRVEEDERLTRLCTIEASSPSQANRLVAHDYGPGEYVSVTARSWHQEKLKPRERPTFQSEEVAVGRFPTAPLPGQEQIPDPNVEDDAA